MDVQLSAPRKSRLVENFERYAKQVMEKAKEHKYSSTQINLPEELVEKIKAFAATIPDEDLAEEGREEHPHITLLFGLHGSDPSCVSDVLSKSHPINVGLRKTSLFENPDADVLKITVDGDELFDLNRKLAENCENTQTHPSYSPHATICYLKPGKGKKYEGLDDFEGEVFRVDSVDFSDKNRQLTTIPLGVKSDLVESFERYAKIHAAKGQSSLDFESLHPRAEDGEFAKKDASPSHGTDPLSLTTENVKDALDANTDDIIRRNPKLSPNMCRSLAAARILNAIGKESQSFRDEIDERVRRDAPVSDEEDDKYMAVADLRKNLFDPLVKLSGYRPGSGDEEHEEAKRPLVAAEEKRDPVKRIESAEASKKQMQAGLFSREDLTGQKSLFDIGNEVFEPKKSKGKSLFETGPSTLEKIEDDLKQKAIAPLAPQKDLFSRIESARISHEATSLPR